MQLGAEAVFVGSGIFKSEDPPRTARAIVEATTHFGDPEHVAKVSRGLGEAMRGRGDGRRSPSGWPTGAGSPTRRSTVTVGVLALQGDVREHAAAFADAGRGRPGRCAGPTTSGASPGIVLPGGESTTLSMLLESLGLCSSRWPRPWRAGLPAFGTCAGLVLLARTGARRPPRPAAVRACSTARSGATATAASSTPSRACCRRRPWPGLGERRRALPAVFIRAPVVEAVGPEVEVLATLASGRAARRPRRPHPVVCRQGPVLAGDVPPRAHRRPPAAPAVRPHGRRNLRERDRGPRHRRIASPGRVQRRRRLASERRPPGPGRTRGTDDVGSLEVGHHQVPQGRGRTKARAKLFAKLIRQLEVAAREGGSDIETNATLRTSTRRPATPRCRWTPSSGPSSGAPASSKGSATRRSTTRATRPAAWPCIVETLTDNRNRTGAEIRNLFDRERRLDGRAGRGSWQFERKGVLGPRPLARRGPDHGGGAGGRGRGPLRRRRPVGTDLRPARTWRRCATRCEAAGIAPGLGRAHAWSRPRRSPSTTRARPSGCCACWRLIDDHDDVQSVHANYDIPDEVLADFEG